MAKDSKDLDALLAALNRSGERLQTLWFSFLALTLYLVITALTTTHRMLLLEEPQQLPIVNLKLPLLPFYVLAPLLYLIVHFYVLLMLLLLARSASVFEEELRRTFPIDADREQYRMRIENTPFLQLLVGAKPERTGANGFFVSAMALITVGVAPVLTLVVMQMQFLPYHHFAITWAHRGFVLLDVLLVLFLWRGYRWRWGRARPNGAVSAWRARQNLWGWRVALTTLGVVASLWLTLWEGRWAGEPGIGSMDRRLDSPAALIDLLLDRGERSLNEGSAFDLRLLIGAGLFSDRLRLPNETLVGETLLDEKRKESAVGGGKRTVYTRDFRSRNFAYADFSMSDLRGVDLTDGQGDDPVSRATVVLTGANLQGALLQEANLQRAQLQDADLSMAKLQGARMWSAQLQGANLISAQLQGANVVSANLQGANLMGAQLQGANLSGAELQAADLSGAPMQGASLLSARLQGADLVGAQLQGADLAEAQLQGADLRLAQLQGANITDAHLQGASLEGAQLQGARVVRNFVFRTSIKQSDVKDAFLQHNFFSAITSVAQDPPAELTSSDVTSWRSLAIENVADGHRRHSIGKRFDRLTELSPTSEDTAIIADWHAKENDFATGDRTGAYHRAARAALLSDLVCGQDAAAVAPHVARRLTFNLEPEGFLYSPHISFLGDQLGTFRNRLKLGRDDPKQCPGVVGLTDKEWRSLNAIKPNN